MTVNSELNNIIDPVVNGLGFEFVGCDYIAQGKHSILRVYIDKENGVTIDDCAVVSRQLSAVLDVEDAIKLQYQLEVSSPGLNRPLFTIEHFRRFIGSEVKVHLTAPIDGVRNFTGLIKAVEGDNIVLQIGTEEMIIPQAGLAKANLIYKDKEVKR